MYSGVLETKRKREKRALRVRRSVGRSQKLRLTIFRSAKHIYGQVINDADGVTLAGIGSYDKELRTIKDRKKVAKEVGLRLAKLATSKNVKEVVFDRGSYKYHGRVAAFADGAREGGLEF